MGLSVSCETTPHQLLTLTFCSALYVVDRSLWLLPFLSELLVWSLTGYRLPRLSPVGCHSETHSHRKRQFPKLGTSDGDTAQRHVLSLRLGVLSSYHVLGLACSTAMNFSYFALR